ncbi:MraY family glycosyltransferase [Candidatus Vallotia cooleyia]|uniref:MraY family glycosyltransferase n=1 Tax=Candidatus Vallotiella adelgis TaxID=1177211 RepID=UPI001D00B4A2|nr:glycosyltransferase family 4 protein [Candidatus Vallotia cooleyia]UDG82438.1 putative undecaprenyl-phosphate N-acetylglucosaminyl 1-phosphate transferase [Candidatus Vallotia cooleyia]
MLILDLHPAGVCLLLAVIALVAVAAVLAVLLKTGLSWHLAIDLPNERSLHIQPTPRVGGWGIIPVVVLIIWLVVPTLRLIMLTALLLAALSQIDDYRGLSARIRFIGHLAAVATLVIICRANVPKWAIVIMVFLFAWIVNVYNFMDGADGLAGGMALLGFSGYAIAALISKHPDVQLAMACSAVAGGSAGFLLFNFYPARVFLGDVGSIPLGFLVGAFGYCGWKEDVWPVWFPMLTFSPFISDASITLLKRVIRKERFWKAHREHYYQRMIRSGLGHAMTALIWYLVIIVCIIFSLIALRFDPIYQWILVIGWILVLMLIGVSIDRRWQRYTSECDH